MMDCKAVFREVDALYEEYLDVWEDLCNIESPTDYKAGVDACCSFVVEWAHRRGLDVEILRQDVSGDVASITLNPSADKAPLCLSGHLDTVHPVGSFGTPAVHRDEKNIYGPGVLDCKGGVAAAMLAMDALQRSGFTDRPVRLLLQSDEEKGSNPSKKATINYICEKAKDAVAFLNLEGFREGKAVIRRKGILTFTFKVTGKAAHGSNCATRGASAILEAAHKIIEMEKLKDDDGLTCTCGTIKGGTTTNTVADYCEFTANVRFATSEQMAWVREYAQKVADMVHVRGCTATVNQPAGRPPMDLADKNVALFETMNSIFAENGLPVLEAAMAKGGSDAAYVTLCGIPCVDSLGTQGEGFHAPEEYCILESLRESAYRIVAVATCI